MFNEVNIDSDNTHKKRYQNVFKRFEATFDRVLSLKSNRKDVFNFEKACMKLI